MQISSAYLKNLKKLILKSCKKLTDAAIKDLPTGLKILNIGSSDLLTVAAIKDLPEDLEELNLFMCPQLTGGMAKDLPRRLKCLNLVACKNMSNKILEDLSPNIETLKFSFDTTMEITSCSLPQRLKHLCYHAMKGQSTPSLFRNDLPESLDKLELIDLEDFSDSGIRELPRGLKELKVLNIKGCKHLTAAAVANLPKNLKVRR